MQEIGHFINGRPVAGESGRFGDVFNPATGELSARVALASAAEVDPYGASRSRGMARLGGDTSAAARAGDVQAEGVVGTRPQAAFRCDHRGTWQGSVGRRR